MFIVDPNMPEDEIDKLNAQVEALVTDGGGQVESIEKLGRKRLAYEIQRHKQGFYVLFTVAADGTIVQEVERRFRVMDSVLRYLTVRVDEAEKKLEKVRAIRQKESARPSPDSGASAEQSVADGSQ
jgi:small subunit ribosomal protein S6